MTSPLTTEAIQVPDLRQALADIREYDERRTRYITALEETAHQQIGELTRQLEDALREAGRQRARADALEAQLRRFPAQPGAGATGARDVPPELLP